MTQNTKMVVLNMTENNGLEIGRMDVFNPTGPFRNKLLGLIRHDTASVSKKKMVKNADEFVQLVNEMVAKIRSMLMEPMDVYVAVQFSEAFIAHIKLNPEAQANAMSHIGTTRVIHYGFIEP